MVTNPYEPTKADETGLSSKPISDVFFLARVGGSSLLILLGSLVLVLGFIASDGKSFFYVVGAQIVLAGVFGLLKKPNILTVTFNGALIIRLAYLMISGTIGSTLLVITSLLLGIPATLNVMAALNAANVRMPKLEF